MISSDISMINVILNLFGLLLSGALVWWVKGMADRKRANNEGDIISNDADQKKREEERVKRHDIANRVAVLEADQHLCTKALLASQLVVEQMTFLIELMLADMELVGHDSKMLARFRVMFERITKDLETNPLKSDALNTAEGAVRSAKQTLSKAKDTCQKVEQSDGGNGK